VLPVSAAGCAAAVGGSPLRPLLPARPLSFTRALPLLAAFSFLLELEVLFIAASSGELLLLHIASHEVEEVGLVEGQQQQQQQQ